MKCYPKIQKQTGYATILIWTFCQVKFPLIARIVFLFLFYFISKNNLEFLQPSIYKTRHTKYETIYFFLLNRKEIKKCVRRPLITIVIHS